ncbi:NAD(+) diphosphatase [Paraburkholderia sp. PREW-6R]|uniref:NAD(+) diphosphatase n=1 Tax=Paraburkholderia sp. PREW-6R TaxID=3141544 RepID=UPI0031F564FB
MPTTVKPASSEPIGFNFNPLDRRSDKRDDHGFIDTLRSDPAARFLVFDGDAPVLKRRGEYDPWFVASEATAFGEPRNSVFLGVQSDGSGRFALGFATGSTSESAFGTGSGRAPGSGPGIAPASTASGASAQQQASPDAAHERIELRPLALGGLVAESVLGIMAEAKSMLDWHGRHSFCANCGTATRVAAAGWQRVCDACGARHFPRVDPVVIMLVIDGERCLLGRQRQFAPGMYSALAGFVEPGETIEDAVRREVMEEAHVTCAEVVYFASQPWPFPSSLMMGCFARASDTDIVVDTTELEDARWFSRAQVAAMLAGTHADGLSAPKPFAIAHHLLRAYVEQGEAVLRRAAS